MTVFNGSLGLSNLYTAFSGRPSWLSTIGTWTPTGEAHLVGINAARGTFTNTQPIALREFNFSGVVAPSINTVFYNRILVEPVRIDLGSIVSEQSRNILVFNGYLSSVTLSSIDQNSFDSGMSFAADSPPYVYLPLLERTYTLTVTVAGQPQIDASIDFNWLGGINSISVVILGSRIVLLPVVFRSQVVETLVWKTDIILAYEGVEQRIRLRRSPRQQLRVYAWLDRVERNRIENLLVGWRKRTWAIPMWIESRYASSPIIEGDTVVNVDTHYADFRIDSLAVIWESLTKFDVFQIGGLTDSTITLLRGVNDDYSNPIIMPVRSARMMGNPVRAASGYDGVLKANLEVVDNIAFDPSASATQFLGEDFYDVVPLYGEGTDGVEDEYDHRIDVLDFESGIVQQYAPWSQIQIGRSFELVLDGLEEIWNHRMWLHRRAGRLRPFYMATYENNFFLLSEGNLGDTIEISQNNYAAQGTERNHIAFRLKSTGAYVFRTVLDAEDLPNGNINITLDSALNVDSGDVEEISFIGLKRLGSDRQSLTWLPNNVALTKIDIKEIEH